MILQPADLKICQMIEKIGLLNLRELGHKVTTDTDFMVSLPGFRICMPYLTCMIQDKLINYPLPWYSYRKNGGRNFAYLFFFVRGLI